MKEIIDLVELWKKQLSESKSEGYHDDRSEAYEVTLEFCIKELDEAIEKSKHAKEVRKDDSNQI